MLEAELQRLRDDNLAIAALLQELDDSLAQPLPPEPPFQVMSRSWRMWQPCRIGSMPWPAGSGA
jgi:hypothetical protein